MWASPAFIAFTTPWAVKGDESFYRGPNGESSGKWERSALTCDGLQSRLDTAPTFPAILPGGSEVNFWAVVFAEVVCAGLIVIGLFTRLAAIPLAITMGVAFFMIHGRVVYGEGGGELALIYGAAYLALVFTGPGGISADSFLFPQTRRSKDD